MIINTELLHPKNAIPIGIVSILFTILVFQIGNLLNNKED